MKQVLIILKGIAIGVANVIPGVSGGTIAFITGIYEDLMEAISQFFRNREKRGQYTILLLLVGAGAGIGILLFSSLMEYLLQAQAQITYLFFLGLIAGSIPVVVKAHHDMRSNLGRILSLALGLLLVVALILLSGAKSSGHREVETVSEFLGVFKITAIDGKYALWMGICGILGAVSMLVPGFSGSALLVTLGEYGNIIYYIDQRMIIPLAFLGAGAALGILAFARVIDWALKRHPSLSFYFILGLILGSFVQIIQQILPVLKLTGISILLSVLSIAAGFFLAWITGRIKPGTQHR